MRIARLLVVLAVVALVLSGVAACGSSSSGGKGGTIEGITWNVAAYADASGAMKDAPVTVPMDARFEGGRVAGKSGCNTYGGSYTV